MESMDAHAEQRGTAEPGRVAMRHHSSSLRERRSAAGGRCSRAAQRRASGVKGFFAHILGLHVRSSVDLFDELVKAQRRRVYM